MTDALAYFSAKLAHETDASDVYAAQKAGDDSCSSTSAATRPGRRGASPGAIHIRRRRSPSGRRSSSTASVPVVVYCWSPGCNAGTKAAIEFAKLGYSVKEMIGGYEYWVREGQPTENDEGPLPRTFDAQVMVVRTPVAP